MLFRPLVTIAVLIAYVQAGFWTAGYKTKPLPTSHPYGNLKTLKSAREITSWLFGKNQYRYKYTDGTKLYHRSKTSVDDFDSPYDKLIPSVNTTFRIDPNGKAYKLIGDGRWRRTSKYKLYAKGFRDQTLIPFMELI